MPKKPDIKNPIFIKKISLKNYRTYKDLEIELNKNIQTLVGPNECGKTNFLLTFELFNDLNAIVESDKCNYVDDFSEIQTEIEFTLNPVLLRNHLNNPSIEETKIKFHGNQRIIECPNEDFTELNGYKISLKTSLPTGRVHITQPELIKELSLPSNHHIEQDKTYEFFIEDENRIKEFKNYIDTHQNKDEIDFIIEKEIKTIPKNEKINKYIDNLNIINWKFDKKYYIPNSIPFSDLKSQPKKYQSIVNFFRIANIDIEDFLNTNDHARRDNILRSVNESVSEVLNQSWTQYQDLELNIFLSSDNALHIGFLENKRTINPNRRSLGFQWFFAFLLHFNANFGNEFRNCIILLDEPGIHLHPGGQKDLLKEIEKLSYYNQVIYTTHLPFMINRNHPERLIILNKKKGITELKKPWKEGVFDNILIANTLGFSFTGLSNFSEVNLFVEGKTDQILIEKLSIVYTESKKEDLLDLNYVSIIPIYGLSNLDPFIRVANMCNINYFGIIDGDEIGRKKLEKYKKKPEKYKSVHEKLFILEDNKEIEDTIPLAILNQSLDKIKQEIYPWKDLIDEEFKFEKGEINPQIDKMITKLIDKHKQNQFDDKIDINELKSTPFKLELMLSVVKHIDAKNFHKFEELINLLKRINVKAIEVLKSLRN
ncbi:MAG: AAA family ATPase [Candidatus Lokiarchaeota archaeon]|nr:AAA family ATPase [Candidatus Lokiarchaeota archaeon]